MTNLKEQAAELLPIIQKQSAHKNDVLILKTGRVQDLIAILTDYIEVKTAPDPLGEALNSGDGSYKP